jgi:hypothetical protein
MKDPADKRTMDITILDGNDPRDKSGAVGLPPDARREFAAFKAIADSMPTTKEVLNKRRPKVGLEVLVARLRRYEQRMVAIALECEDFVHANGQNTNVARIRGIVNGEFDT